MPLARVGNRKRSMATSPLTLPKGMTDTVPSLNPLAVCLLIGSLEFGGAERQVVEMVRTFDRKRVRPIVCSLSNEVPLAKNLPGNAEDLRIVRKRGRFDVTTVYRVAKLLRKEKIDVVHAFLADAEIVARLAALLAGRPVVIASERNTDYTTRLLPGLALKATQSLFDAMIANSRAGKEFNVRTKGIRESRIHVVHNGVDVNRFRPDSSAGSAFREKFAIPQEVPLVGMVGSFKAQKGHRYFLNMAAEVARTVPDAQFIIVGGVIRERSGTSDDYADEIRGLVRALGLEESCRFLGSQEDMLGAYNACDVTALLSLHEGTPNVVLESMACGVPVVVSDVSDNALIVDTGSSGFVVPKEDSSVASIHVQNLLQNCEMRLSMGCAARERVCSEFSLEQAALKLETIYRGCRPERQAGSTIH